MADYEDEEQRRRYDQPYGSKHPIPTIKKYREEVQRREDVTSHEDEESKNDKVRRAYDSAKGILTGDDGKENDQDPYPSASRNTSTQPNGDSHERSDEPDQANEDPEKTKKKKDKKHNDQTVAEASAGETDPKKKRKAMKKNKRTDGGRDVTDPVTHLPITIYDSTPKDLKRTKENYPAPGSTARTMTGLSAASKDQDQLDDEVDEIQRVHDGTQKLFPPPPFEDMKQELTTVHRLGFTVGIGLVAVSAIFSGIAAQLVGNSESMWRKPVIIASLFTAIGSVASVQFVKQWIGKKVEDLWEDEVWDAARTREEETHQDDAIIPESVAWMNSLLTSVWPLINPDLFTSLADMLEDVMQSSLPGLVRMVSIDDLGQGSEAIRILGVRWLPTGAASQSVDEDGQLKSPDNDKPNDRNVPGENEQEENKDDDEEQDLQEGLEAEQGDYVNLELAFAYRARSSGKSLKAKAKNAHLYLKFYFPGGIAVPVWVEAKGAIGKMRLRLQLTPDPPFFSLCTLTFLGQPKVDVSCIPISKHALNLMDVPMISGFVQSSIDAALAEYVAPKSLTLDLKDMLVGDDFKKDTVSKGVVLILIKRARDYKEGDAGIGPLEGSSDTYATVSWGKFGKPAASTRVIKEDQKPDWQEWASILVSPEEINAGEKLRIQLWDSDKFTADDDLGRVEVDLHELMHDEKTRNRICDREDGFMGEDTTEKMPGTLEWSVGYFAKKKITQDQLERQNAKPELKKPEDVENRAGEIAERKLREAKDHQKEIKQQQAQDFKELQDELLTGSPPPKEYSSGVFSIQIHNITGLEIQQLNKHDKEGSKDDEDQADQAEDLPSSYATIIINHEKVYRTRTKPKNAKPFFNASTERFIRDWRDCEVMVSVRDDRERENDALLGMIYLPLNKVFRERSQINASYPLAGGMGYGRIRISMVWRSVELQWPKELRGWNVGTLEVKGPVKATGDVEKSKLYMRTNISQGKMYSQDDHWEPKKDKDSVFLAVKQRYSSAFIIEVGKGMLGTDPPAFAVLWLKDIPDDEETPIKMKVYKTTKGALKRATTSCNYEGEELGELSMTVKFWQGLSGFHKKYANKSSQHDLKNVMECLDVASEERSDDDDGDNSDDSDSSAGADNQTKEKLKPHTNQDSSEDEDSGSKVDKLNPITKIEKLIGSNDDSDGKRGVVSQVRDYKDHRKQLHRKHRGIMQWKGARTLDWALDKARQGAGKIKGVGDHSEKTSGIETEA